jgi:hypothetical protein
MAYHSWQNKAPSEEYSAGHAATFGAKADPFCESCGARMAWCDCAGLKPYVQKPLRRRYLNMSTGKIKYTP